MKLLIASNNAHKIREFRQILPDTEIVSPADLGIEFYHEEIGTTFYENALGKARTLRTLLTAYGKDEAEYEVLADDSGLVVPALGGEPGIYSARYGWQEGNAPMTDKDRNALLLNNMRTIENRNAHYICCMALVSSKDRLCCIQESWEGSISRAESTGMGGFGYDPLFWLEEYSCTVADLPEGLKETLSHRAKAMNLMMEIIHKR